MRFRVWELDGEAPRRSAGGSIATMQAIAARCASSASPATRPGVERRARIPVIEEGCRASAAAPRGFAALVTAPAPRGSTSGPRTGPASARRRPAAGATIPRVRRLRPHDGRLLPPEPAHDGTWTTRSEARTASRDGWKRRRRPEPSNPADVQARRALGEAAPGRRIQQVLLQRERHHVRGTRERARRSVSTPSREGPCGARSRSPRRSRRTSGTRKGSSPGSNGRPTARAPGRSWRSRGPRCG